MSLLKKALLFAACASFFATGALAADTLKPASSVEVKKADASATSAPNQGVLFQPETSVSEGVVTVEGRRIDYEAVAGTIVVHPKDWDDAASREHAKGGAGDLGDKDNPEAEASIFYVAYSKKARSRRTVP